MKSIKSIILNSLAFILVGSGSQNLIAQENNITDTSDILTLEEIIVTATKRLENVQDVPISISVFSESLFEQTASNNLKDLSGLTPNFLFSDGSKAFQADISIRGISNFSSIHNIGMDKGFGSYLDGVYLGQQFAANAELVELERVEILRGPQGTLFGKNTIIGAINATSKKPVSYFEGNIKLDSESSIRTTLNIPLIEDVLAVRISAQSRQVDGYVTNEYDDNDDLGGVDSVNGRLVIGYTPSEQTRVYLAIDSLKSEGDMYAEERVEYDTEPFTVNYDYGSAYMAKNFGASLSIDHDFSDGYTLTSITGVRKDSVAIDWDIDGASIDGIIVDGYTEQELLSQEFRISGQSEGRYDYVVGLYFLEQENYNEQFDILGQDFYPSLAGAFHMTHNVDTSSKAVFAHTNYYLDDEWTLFGGARYTQDDKSLYAVNTLCESAYCGSLIIGQRIDAPVKISNGDPSWLLGLRHGFSDDLMGYVSVSTGFKSASFNDPLGNPEGNHLNNNLVTKPEYVTNYEIGLKAILLGGRATVNTSIFSMDYKDLQVKSYCRTCGVTGTNILSNAASLTSKGLELEAVAQLSERLVVNVGLGYIDAVYDDYDGVTDGRPASAGGIGIIDATGNRAVMAPKWSFNAAIIHELPLEGGMLNTRLDYNYLDEFYTGENGEVNSKDYLNPSRGLVNASISYITTDDRWTITLWGKNLADEVSPVNRRYHHSAGQSSVKEHFIQPRSTNVSVSYRFGGR
tara:strand:+ start:4571 stop:6796 length:2226 start_codon:yes stop_codon:yes gene_type:complete